jgi:non-canonical (house-cleaning) NTP pyrophosphatase
MKVIVGSMSALKTTVVEIAMRELGQVRTIVSVPVASGVASQPVGEDETLRGARQRAMSAKAVDSSVCAIGIENGIRQVGNGWEDWAVIVLLPADGTEIIVHSDGVAVPTDIVEVARARGFSTTTVGAVLAERFGSLSDDPHTFLTGGRVSRQELLVSAVVRALAQVG